MSGNLTVTPEGDLVIPADRLGKLKGVQPESLRIASLFDDLLVCGQPQPGDRPSALMYGDLRLFHVGELMALISSMRRDGYLSLFIPHARKTVYFSGGEIVYATSTVEDDRLGEILWRRGFLDLEQLYEVHDLVTPQKKLGAILVERKLITPRQLYEGIKEQVQDGIGEPSPGHHFPAKILDFRGEGGGLGRPSLEEILAKVVGIEPFIGLDVVGQHHHPQVPGAAQERLNHQGVSKPLEGRQTVKGFQGGPETDPQTQVGPIPLGDHRLFVLKFGEAPGQIRQGIGHKTAGYQVIGQNLGLGHFGAAQELGQNRGKENHASVRQAQDFDLFPQPQGEHPDDHVPGIQPPIVATEISDCANQQAIPGHYSYWRV